MFPLAAINPVQCSRLALLSGAQPELSTFGPVGFYLANKVGSAGLFWVGIGWPLLLSFAFPLRQISMKAPHYPDGLKMDIWSYQVVGGNDGHDIE